MSLIGTAGGQTDGLETGEAGRGQLAPLQHTQQPSGQSMFAA